MLSLPKKRCPSCKRAVFTRRDMLYAPVDATASCRACGRTAQLDLFSRWVVSCAIAMILATVLLYGGLFYSGHLFLVSMIVIFAAWRLITAAAFPYLSLEDAPEGSAFVGKRSVLMIAVLLAAGMMVDGFLASRFEAEDALENVRAPKAESRER
jgi:hypothetical protein